MGGQRGRLISAQDKARAIELIEEACEAGARIKPACGVLGLNIRTLQRWRNDVNLEDRRCGPITAPANKLTDAERATMLATANKPELCDLSPNTLVPALADRGVYLASVSSFTRVLKEANQFQHRSAVRPKKHKKPKALMADKPNQLWSWDITYLPSTIKGKYFYLYLFMDIFSRKIVGFDVFGCELAEHAAAVVTKAYHAEELKKGDVILHSDNGSPMKGITMLATLQVLGVIPSFSRPSVSDDNPFSEALFRTVKYHPWYPRKPFESVEAALAWVIAFVDWYNNVHLHSGIKFVTPNDRHQGLDIAVLENRTRLFAAAKEKRPDRWSGDIRNWEPAGPVYLNNKQSSKEVKIEI